jgi:hypothetical protein
MAVRPGSVFAAAVGFVLSAGFAPAQLSIVLNPTAGFAANLPAVAAFNRAALAWSSRVTNPVTITIGGDFGPLASGTLGSTGQTLSGNDFNTVRNAMAARSGLPGLSVLASLPTSSQFTAATPSGTLTNPASIFYTQANGKALSLTTGGFAVDATITFNNNPTVTFDFDRSNGVTAGTFDFETVAVHEIGHALGFATVVDAGNNNVRTWDLFRFNLTNTPATAADFTNFNRELRPGQEAVQHDLTTAYRLSTGVTGDGNQASHWKSSQITGVHIGVMDPILPDGQFFNPSEADFRALELIGYTVIPVPEPAGVLAAVGLAVCRRWRKKPTDAPTLAA